MCVCVCVRVCVRVCERERENNQLDGIIGTPNRFPTASNQRGDDQKINNVARPNTTLPDNQTECMQNISDCVRPWLL